MFKIEKVYTENPYVDELVYYTKLLSIDTVIKNLQEAEDAETVESLKNGELYISCVDGTVIFEVFPSYSRYSMEKAGLPESIIQAALKNKNEIPLSKRPAVLKNMVEEFIANYDEKNNYYRMLAGLPNYGAEPLYVVDWVAPPNIDINLDIPIHEMPQADINILIDNGVIDDLLQDDYMNRRYLRYVGVKRINPYLSRKSSRFDILYIPKVENDAIYKMYKEKIEVSRDFVLKTIYSEAYKYDSDYYDSFISILIVIITMIDLISRVQELIARKEILDIRSIEYIFKSYGIPYFEDIPMKYQINMVKNLHTLLKFKSTSQCMIDICSLFGFNNVNIFKYYLLKDRNIDITTGEYTFATKEITNPDGTISTVDDTETNYELKFVKVPLQGKIDDYIRNPANHANYDDITSSDEIWDGGMDHEEVKRQILDQEFNYTRSKYISIDTVYDMAKLSMQQSYFFNILFDDVKLEELVKVAIPYIGPHDFRVSDVFTLLTTLSYSYHNMKDLIVDTGSKVLHINGFNFKADLAQIAADLRDQGYGLDALKVLDKFKSPENQLISFHELMNLFVNNLEIRDVLIEAMYKADNMRVYKVYKQLYDALMISELTFDFYKNPDTGDFYRDINGDATYTEFLKSRDSSLYYALLEIDTFEDEESKIQYIANLIDNIVYALEEYIDGDKFSGIFNGLPVVSVEAVKQYIAKMINFFKSYKVDFLGLNTIYYLDDKLDGLIKIIDDVELQRFWEKNELVKFYEIARFKSTMTKSEQIKFIERMYLDIRTWRNFNLSETVKITDSAVGINTIFYQNLIVKIIDDPSIKVNFTGTEIINIGEISTILATKEIDDSVKIYDKLWIIPEESV